MPIIKKCNSGNMGLFTDCIDDVNTHYYHLGQACTAGSRIFVQEGIFDAFVEKFVAATEHLSNNIGDPFHNNTLHGPQVSQVQFDVRTNTFPD